MSLEICTLYEGGFHFGVGSLANSLYAHGYRGTLWIGYRGKLPCWVPDQHATNPTEYRPADDLCLKFVHLETSMHFTHYKATWMLSIFDSLSPHCQALAYFDPDIVIKCRWSFFEEWIRCGIALCEDVNHYMPADHPIKQSWMQFLQGNGYEVQRRTHQYFNGGFLGLQRRHADALLMWERLTGLVEPESGSLHNWRSLDRSHRFMSANQDTLNLVAMATAHPVTTLGPEGMDFAPGGFTMSHAVGSCKPWSKSFITEALRGNPPTSTDKGFLAHCRHPIQLYSDFEFLLKRVGLRCGSAIGRFVRRN